MAEWLKNLILALFGAWLNKPKPVSADEKLGAARAELEARDKAQQQVRDADAAVRKVEEEGDDANAIYNDPNNRSRRRS